MREETTNTDPIFWRLDDALNVAETLTSNAIDVVILPHTVLSDIEMVDKNGGINLALSAIWDTAALWGMNQSLIHRIETDFSYFPEKHQYFFFNS